MVLLLFIRVIPLIVIIFKVYKKLCLILQREKEYIRIDSNGDKITVRLVVFGKGIGQSLASRIKTDIRREREREAERNAIRA